MGGMALTAIHGRKRTSFKIRLVVMPTYTYVTSCVGGQSSFRRYFVFVLVRLMFLLSGIELDGYPGTRTSKLWTNKYTYIYVYTGCHHSIWHSSPLSPIENASRWLLFRHVGHASERSRSLFSRCIIPLLYWNDLVRCGKARQWLLVKLLTHCYCRVQV
jgi:hypothetical protein